MGIFADRYKESMDQRAVHVMKAFDPREKRDKYGRWLDANGDHVKVGDRVAVTRPGHMLGGSEGVIDHAADGSDEPSVKFSNDESSWSVKASALSKIDKQGRAHGGDVGHHADEVEKVGKVFEVPDKHLVPVANELERRAGAVPAGSKREDLKTKAAHARHQAAKSGSSPHKDWSVEPGHVMAGSEYQRGAAKRKWPGAHKR